MIYHSTFIGRADAKNKGRISRYLANKCSIATRIDSFSDEPSRLYGEKLREQVEERLKFYETGAAPRRNIDVMQDVAKQLKVDDDSDEEMAEVKTPSKKEKKEKKKKRKSTGGDDDVEMTTPKKAKKDDGMETPKKSEKKAKKEKKSSKKEKKSEKKKRKSLD